MRTTGYNSATGKWAVDDLIAADGYQSITIPTCIPSGQYLLRAELIALHSAGGLGSAQFYMECAQINVIGGTGGSPSTVSFPGAYSATDPGVLISIYPVKPPYVIPGPRPYTCGGSTNPQPTTTRGNTSPTTTTRAAVTTTRAATTTSAAPSTGGAPLYGQCGGIGWVSFLPSFSESNTNNGNLDWTKDLCSRYLQG